MKRRLVLPVLCTFLLLGGCSSDASIASTADIMTQVDTVYYAEGVSDRYNEMIEKYSYKDADYYRNAIDSLSKSNNGYYFIYDKEGTSAINIIYFKEHVEYVYLNLRENFGFATFVNDNNMEESYIISGDVIYDMPKEETENTFDEIDTTHKFYEEFVKDGEITNVEISEDSPLMIKVEVSVDKPNSLTALYVFDTEDDSLLYVDKYYKGVQTTRFYPIDSKFLPFSFPNNLQYFRDNAKAYSAKAFFKILKILFKAVRYM